MNIVIDKATIIKYDVPGPRYTSYPTAPVWSDEVNEDVYINQLKAFGQTDKTLSLYIHIPFCQSMCTFCACSVLIRKAEKKYGDEYLQHLFREIELISKYIGKRPVVRQLHWGGGTPTFLTEEQIQQLFLKIQRHFDVDLSGEIAIEIDPRTITRKKIETLKKLGFNRISMGIQDFDADVQKGINRIQSLAMVKEVYQWCRDYEFDSINFDLIYGLPHQTQESFTETSKRIIDMRPDRIAFYSFAYVPWLKKHQTKIDTATLPDNDEKLDIFLNAREHFLDSGYQAIAMDHFALDNDELAKAFNNGKLHRNFMGYTVKPADEFIGLGLTAIGFLQNTFIQNAKLLQDYYDRLAAGQLPVERGKRLDQDDCIRQWTINSLMCQFCLDKQNFQKLFGVNFEDYFRDEQGYIFRCAEDELLENSQNFLKVTELGKIFIRNICMGFDKYLRREQESKKFSRTV